MKQSRRSVLCNAGGLVAWLVLLSLGMAGCEQGEGAPPVGPGAKAAPPPSAVPGQSGPSSEAQGAARVTVVTVERQPWPRTVRVQGSLWCDERVVVGAKVAGRVKEVNVDLGDRVKQNEVLASLEPEEFDLKVQQAEAQVEQVRASLGLAPGDDENKLDRRMVPTVVQEQATRDEARANWERAEGLARDMVISEEERDQRKTALDVAEARCQAALLTVNESIALLRVRQAEAALARQAQTDAVIRAPFDGIIEQRLVAPGAYLQVSEPVVSLVRIDPLRFRAGVPELETSRLAIGQPVEIYLEGRQDPLVAKITRISPSLDLANRSLTIEADLPNSDFALRSGIFAEGEIVVDADAKTLAVPSAAVSEFAGVEKVQLLRDGKPVPQVVKTGRRQGEMVEILEGLAQGDRIEAGGKE